jgi:MFS family permease
MVKDLGIDEKDASLYAGLLVSAYAVAEALTSMGWGVLSDRIGRKPVVLLGLVGVALSSLIFGLAKSYWVALLARFVGGALNGNVSVMQTMVAEMVKLPEHERKFSLSLFKLLWRSKMLTFSQPRLMLYSLLCGLWAVLLALLWEVSSLSLRYSTPQCFRKMDCLEDILTCSPISFQWPWLSLPLFKVSSSWRRPS